MTQPKLSDPLVDADRPDRPHYALGVMLDARDFTDEQTYHRARLARMLQFLHGIGTIAGLRVTPKAAVAATPTSPGRDEEISVGAGLAIDGRGRLIELPLDWCISLPRWLADQNVKNPDGLFTAFDATAGVITADVFLRFEPCRRGMTPAFASGPFDALDATGHARVRDGFELRLVPRDPATTPPPVDPWAAITGATPAARLASAREAVLDLWTHVAKREDRDGIPAILDPELDWLWLARVAVPATRPAGGTFVRTATAPTVDNMVRSFALPAGALLRIVGA